jgi:hypothetical protein
LLHGFFDAVPLSTVGTPPIIPGNGYPSISDFLRPVLPVYFFLEFISKLRPEESFRLFNVLVKYAMYRGLDFLLRRLFDGFRIISSLRISHLPPDEVRKLPRDFSPIELDIIMLKDSELFIQSKPFEPPFFE